MKPTLHTVAIIVAGIAVVLIANAWRSARHDSDRLAAMLASQNAAIRNASEREKQRNAELSVALAAIAKQKTKVQTPQQAAKGIPSVMPPLPLPISIHFPNLTASPKPNDDLPASISIPQVDLKPLYDSLQDCRANAIENDAIKKDLTDEKAKAAALLLERDAALALAHGGTFWVRLKRGTKWLAIGIAIGATATAVARHY